jgi:hypothetical protein
VVFGEEACESEIANFEERVVSAEEYIFWFNVAVDNIFGVEILKALDDFVEDGGDELGIESLIVLLDEVEEVAIEVLKDEIDLAFLLEGLLDAHHVFALEHLKHLYLALDGHVGKLVFIALLEFLDRHSLPPEVPKLPLSLLRAFHTIPYAPSSITSIISYLCMINITPSHQY